MDITAESETLSQQATSGLSWQLLASLVRMVASFGFGIVLARILMPEDFGVVGIAYMATSFAYVLTDLGLGPAIVQRRTVTERHIRVCHTISVAIAVLMTAALFGGAQYVAAFFNDARIGPVLQVLAFASFFSGFGITSNALLVRRLEFRITVKIELFASVLGYGGVAVALAYLGYGYWSLVAGTMAQSVISSLLTYATQRHSLRPLVSRAEIRELVGFSTGISLAGIVNFCALKGDYFIVGRMMDAASLGFYTRAYTLMEIPHVFFGSALGRVLFPAASRVQDDPERFRRAYLTTFAISVAAALPLSLALVVLAPELITSLYGSNWAPAVPALQVLSFFGMLRVTYNTASAFIRARGHAYQLLSSTIVYGALVIIGSWWAATSGGIEQVAWAVGGAIAAMWILAVWFANRAAAVSTSQFTRAFVVAAAPGIVMTLGLFFLVVGMRKADMSPVAILVLAGGMFAIAAAGTFAYQVHRLGHAAIDDVVIRVLLRIPLVRGRLRPLRVRPTPF